jgi:predicted outer membrane repeat protein
MRGTYHFQKDLFITLIVIGLLATTSTFIQQVHANALMPRSSSSNIERRMNVLQLTCAPTMTVAAGNVDELIAAIDCANAQPGDDIIHLTTSTYTLTAVNNTSTRGDNGLPIIQNNGKLTIYGHGATITGVTSNPTLRLIYIDTGATVALDSLALNYGVAPPLEYGGGIYSVGTLTVTNSSFSYNSAGGWGGGIFSQGILSITDSVFSNNQASIGGGIGSGSGDVVVSNSTFSNNSVSANGGGIAFDMGSLTLSNSIFSDNSATTSGGGIYAASIMEVTGSTFVNNTANVGGGIDNGGNATISSSKFLANSGIGAAGGIINRSQLNIAQSCLVGNADGLVNNGGTVTAANNWWGSITGPAGDGTGSGDDAIGTNNFTPYLTQAIMSCPFVNATVRGDVYFTSAGTSIRANGQGANPPGVLANDVEVATAEQLTDTNYTHNQTLFGTLSFNPDGTFIYTPNTANIGDVDAFRYRGQDAGGNLLPSTLVCISISNLEITAPPSKQTMMNQSIPITGVKVTAPNPNTLITLQLEVQHGTLQVQGQQTIADLQTCRERLGLTAAYLPNFRPPGLASFALQNTRSRITLSGTQDQLNTWLDTLVYTPNTGFVGVDNLIIIANDTSDGFVQANTIIYVIGGSTSDLIPDAIPIDQSDIFQIEVPPDTVPNGTIFLRVIARYGTFLVPTAEIGDTIILELGVIHGADLFALTHAGIPAIAFNHSVKICIRGEGAVYYRDATGVPRVTVPLPTFRSGAYTCVYIPNAGTVVLTQYGNSPGASSEMPEMEQPLADCQVRVNNRLNLRNEPGAQGSIITLLPYDVVLTALKRSGDWFYVDYLGQFGWVSSQYLTPKGDCGS